MSEGINIGNLKVPGTAFLAPMAGFANLPFRRLCRRFGCDFVTTEMVSAEGLVRNQSGSKQLLADHPEDRPRAVQIFGRDPVTMAEAACIVADAGLADVLDINMGCPVKKVVSAGAGAALLKDPERAQAIVEAVRRAVDLPLTVKMRSGWDSTSICAVDLGCRLAQAGADAIFLHPRTRSQGFSGEADWSIVARLVRAVEIPVIGGGDVSSPGDVCFRLEQTGCAAVQVGRASLGNPCLFEKWPRGIGSPGPDWNPSPRERFEAFMSHVALYLEFTTDEVAARELRKHVGHYFKEVPGASWARAAAQKVRSCAELLDLAEALLCGRNEVDVDNR